MGVIYVGVGDYAASNTPGDVVRTIGLGSCVGVILLAPRQRAVGLLHIALPDSSINLKRAENKPGTFADTGIPAVLKEMKKLGVTSSRDLAVKLAGGAAIMDSNNIFNIGKRNILAARKILWKYRLGALAEDVGGNISRSVTVDVNTGKIVISSPGRGDWEL